MCNSKSYKQVEVNQKESDVNSDKEFRGVHLIELNWKTAIGIGVSMILLIVIISFVVACNTGCIYRTWNYFRGMWGKNSKEKV